jgi:ABC-type uncharacterized transport system involved in gliding motility auxiliary subunit
MKNNTKFGINALIVTAIVVAAVILLNAVVSTIASKTSLKLDLTRDSVYEFSEYTKEVMKNIDKEISVYALYPDGDDSNMYNKYAKEYLAKYEALSSNFKVTFVDPYTNPNFTKAYEEQGESISVGSIILECGDNVKIVAMEQMYSNNPYNGETKIDMEKKITSAVLNVTGSSKTAKIYFVEGHDEFESKEFASTLADNGYECGSVNIALQGIPEDAALVVVMAPSNDWSAEERDALDKYLDKGGKAMFVLEPGTKVQPRMAEYLAEWGFSANNDYVVEGDPDHAFQFQNGMVVPAPIFVENSINEKLIKRKLAYMAIASQSIELNDKNLRYASIRPLLVTTENSWGKVNLSAQTTAKEAGDTEGPLTIAAISEMQDGSNAKVFVLGSLQAVELNGILNESAYANGDFLLNSVAYMTNTASSMDIRAKVISAPRLAMTQAQVLGIWLILQYFLPFIIIVIGLVVWLRRRYK